MHVTLFSVNILTDNSLVKSKIFSSASSSLSVVSLIAFDILRNFIIVQYSIQAYDFIARWIHPKDKDKEISEFEEPDFTDLEAADIDALYEDSSNCW